MWPPLDEDVQCALAEAYRSGSWGRYHGDYCPQFARQLQEYLQAEHCVLCSSGTAAIELALRGAGVGPSDEVVLAAYDFKANFQNVLITGATPVLADVDPRNRNLAPAGVEAVIGPQTKAIIASHLHGGLVPMPALMDVSAAHRIPVIEDACQATGAMIGGRRAGMWGDVGVFSFGGSKLLTAGRGGAVFGNNAKMMQRIRLYSFRGNDAYPLSELQAAVLIPQLRRLDERNRKRSAAVARLIAGLGQGLRAFDNSTPGAPAWYKVGLLYDPQQFAGLSRDQFSASMRAEGIAMDPGLRGLHLIHSRRRYCAAGELGMASDTDAHIVTLHHPILLQTDQDIDCIPRAVERIRRHAALIAGRSSENNRDKQTGDSRWISE